MHSLRGLAAQAPELCCPFHPHREQRAQGRPGAGWHPGSAYERRTRGDHRCCRDIPAFPAQWFYGLWRALPGERCTIAPVALQMTDVRTRSGRHTTASLDAQTPGVRTTRFCRPRTSLPGHPEARACSPPKPKGNAVTAPCRMRGSRWLTGVARPATPSRAGAAASIASRLTYRDDRETPLLAGQDGMRFNRRREFGQSEYLAGAPLTCMWHVLPVGQREGWCGQRV